MVKNNEGFDYDLDTARQKGNLFEKIFHNGRVNFWLSKLEYKNKKILDVGCNTGILLIPLMEKGADAWGIDISEGDIAKVKGKLKDKGLPTGRVKVADARKIPFPNSTFDLVILSDVLEHISSPEKAAKEAIRVIKPGGRAYVTVPNSWHPVVKYPWVRKLLTGRKDVDEHLDVPYNKQKLIKLFPKNKVLKVGTTGFWSEIFGVFTK